ncbi:hypothetical protein BH11PSE9_BH11PSE9_18460 [soil metagenome]
MKWLGDKLQRPVGGDKNRPAAPSHGEALRHDHRDLSRLLDKHSDSRLTMRHLACVEQALARHGSRAFKLLSSQVMGKALTQLEALAIDSELGDFTELRTRLRQASGARQSMAAPQDLQSVDVSEASHSLFDEMERSWTGQMPTAA